eukprot:5283372-Alexandrium_andersonii.AAC.1
MPLCTVSCRARSRHGMVSRKTPDCWLGQPSWSRRRSVQRTYRCVIEGGECEIDSTGWAPASSFYRCVAQLRGPDALRTACEALTEA